ncbi:MAG: cation transporter [Desulfobacterales bacterium]|nr:MAG: cation transporter [Desulfobacterales bacterium]
MIKRYLLIGVISLSALLLVAALITAKINPGSQQDVRPVAKLAGQDPVPAVGRAKTNNSGPIANSAKAVLDVQGMSCSGCIYTIKSSLAGFEGIRDVLVDVGSGRVEVFYDSSKLKNLEPIASAITAAGYPATLKQTLTKDEVEKENDFFASRSKLYVAAVGDWEISRDDFNTELAHIRSRYQKVYGENIFSGDQGGALLQRLQSQVASSLISEGIQMQEIRKAGFRLPKQTVEQELSDYLAKKDMALEQFRQALKDAEYDYDYFVKKFENRVTIDRYLNEKILSGLTNDLEKRQQYADWYNNAQLLAKVVYYDKNLENIVNNSAAGSGCGSSCTKQ